MRMVPQYWTQLKTKYDTLYIKGIEPTTLIGRTIKCIQDDGTILQAQVDTCLNQHDELRDQKFKVVYNNTYQQRRKIAS